MMTYTADLQRCDLDNAGQARTPATTCLMLFMLNVKLGLESPQLAS